jgi:hypothetical protein
MKNINIEKITKSLLNSLPERSIDVLARRFGLFGHPKSTLESIGKTYGITRERVRQIESYALANIKTNLLMQNPKCQSVLDFLHEELNKCGQIVNENDFLEKIASNDNEKKNYAHFFLVLGGGFKQLKEDENFFCRWTVADLDKIEKIQTALIALSKSLSTDEILTEEEMIENFKNHFSSPDFSSNLDKTHIRYWLKLSKNTAQNCLGEWGLSHSPSIRPRGIRDYTYLVMRKHGSPMHFTEVAKAIQINLNKHAHVQTVHNELIKDNRFVLVGRGLYALKEWGYMSGAVRDVMIKILKKAGPLSKSELMKRVLKERHVQESTISINLQNRRFFKKLASDLYHIV